MEYIHSCSDFRPEVVIMAFSGDQSDYNSTPLLAVLFDKKLSDGPKRNRQIVIYTKYVRKKKNNKISTASDAVTLN